jgi:hypothetical protein
MKRDPLKRADWSWRACSTRTRTTSDFSPTASDESFS